ncbi:glycoside hydrolase family 3 C-terminal domain-containing protein [Paucilactobacillus kaifaensis]|uniref:glycoside hydrolase family 3 C-terminal domain-containing protein n=1 Tax=Paucilactobacillus kaifaensis TaxID=2559921 RepID=UPI0010F757A9|nr:glycoside hydrolase family 3 C-terminal domain-containing protein [Paucilactobacillus kaifaensis]
MTVKFDLSFVQGLTVSEKAELVSGKNFWFTAKNEDKDIPGMMMTDGPSGLRKQADSADALGLNKSVEAICFPSSALTASSFNTKMLFELGENLGIAARTENVDIVLGPGVNIKRSPLAGRNFEYFSEDPFLVGELGSAYVEGVQSKGVGVSVKHFAANNRENQRFTSTSNVDERTLREIYLTAFETIVRKAHPATLMCSYNAINGVLNSQNYRLLTEILRNEWGFQGAVMSDWGAVADNIAALKAGLDLEMPGTGTDSSEKIIAAIKDGSLEETQLDTAVLRVLQLVEKYHINATKVAKYDKDDQHEFARKAAESSIVLLQNNDAILPIKSSERIAVIGELAQKPRYQGGGSSHVNAYKVVSPLDAVKHSNLNYQFTTGYQLDTENGDEELEKQALESAKASDKVVFFAGVPEQMESEGFDKQTMDLPANQTNLINQLSQANSNLIVVLQNGSAVTMPWKDNVKVIVETYLAGEAVGEATWNILTGVVNPSGKLAETFPQRIQDTPAYGTFNASVREENYHEGIFVGYRYYDLKQQAVNFPFGHGLSYTTFKYDNLRVDPDSNKIKVSFEITNTGDVAGDEVSQLYVQNSVSSIELPVRELKGFKKVHLNPGEKQTVQLLLDRRSFAWYDVESSTWRVDNGEYEINVGSSSRDLRLQQTINVNLGSEAKPLISGNTYLSEVVQRDDLKDALIKSGLKQIIDGVTESDENRELLENIPLRSMVMLGISAEQMSNFIELANQK